MAPRDHAIIDQLKISGIEKGKPAGVMRAEMIPFRFRREDQRYRLNSRRNRQEHFIWLSKSHSTFHAASFLLLEV